MINHKIYIPATITFAFLAAISYKNFLLFHTVAELFSIVIAFGIFIVAWNTRRFASNNYLLFLGIIYLFVAIIDLTHTLAYKGMNIFHGYGANLPTQLWIGARYLESISLAIAPLFFTRRLNVLLTVSVYSAICALLFAFLFIWPIYPDCFIEGSGLTAFKKNSEYLISIILLGAAAFLHKERSKIDGKIFKLLISSIFLTICGEIAFTYYVSVYGISNITGHFFKIASFYLIYKAVIVETLTTPYQSLFRDITESEKEKRTVIRKLEESLEQVKLLQGILPICSHCKKIRDDKGYWQQVEEYISKHSTVLFSHGVCDECIEKHYNNLLNPNRNNRQDRDR